MYVGDDSGVVCPKLEREGWWVRLWLWGDCMRAGLTFLFPPISVAFIVMHMVASLYRRQD